MTVSLQKGQKIDLTKGRDGLKQLVVGLGWDEAGKSQAKKKLFGRSSANSNQIDCDAIAILCNEQGKINSPQDVVFYNNQRHASGAVQSMGDNLTGAGEGDDEQIMVNLEAVPAEYAKIVFVVTIYQARERQQHFGAIENAFIRVVNAANNEELCRYNLSESYENMTAMIFGEVYRHNGEWKFSAVGQGTNDDGVSEIARRFM